MAFTNSTMKDLNEWAWIIIVIMACEWIIEIIDAYLNLSNMSSFIPVEFDGIYNPDDYKKSQQYTKSKTVFGLFQQGFQTVLFCTAWMVGGFNALDLYIQSFNYNELITGVLYILSIMIISLVFSLPFSLYSDFVLEAHYGFNKKTFVTFVKDFFLSLFLSILFGIPLLSCILSFFLYAGANAWIYCWICTSAFSLFMAFISPKYILPLFNTLEPLSDGTLKTSIYALSQKLSFSFEGIYIMDGSKRSSHSNAFFTGFGSTKRIVLFDTLVENQSDEEIVSVLGHEIGHYQKNHIFWGIGISIFLQGLMFFVLQFFISSPEISQAFFMDSVSVYTGLLFFGQIYTPIQFISNILLSLRSRIQEYEADRFSIDCTQDPESLISALKKLCKDNLSNLTPHPFHVFLSYSHPPMIDRINAIREYSALTCKKAN